MRDPLGNAYLVEASRPHPLDYTVRVKTLARAREAAAQESAKGRAWLIRRAGATLEDRSGAVVEEWQHGRRISP